MKTTSQVKPLSQPPDWWEAFKRKAAKEGLSLSEWVGRVCVQNLSASERRKLSKRIGRGKPKNE